MCVCVREREGVRLVVIAAQAYGGRASGCAATRELRVCARTHMDGARRLTRGSAVAMAWRRVRVVQSSLMHSCVRTQTVFVCVTVCVRCTCGRWVGRCVCERECVCVCVCGVCAGGEGCGGGCGVGVCVCGGGGGRAGCMACGGRCHRWRCVGVIVARPHRGGLSCHAERRTPMGMCRSPHHIRSAHVYGRTCWQTSAVSSGGTCWLSGTRTLFHTAYTPRHTHSPLQSLMPPLQTNAVL